MNIISLILWSLAIIALTAALFATMIRLVGGPNTLDRLISLDALVALALVAFLGSVSVARFRVNDTVGTPEEALP